MLNSLIVLTTVAVTILVPEHYHDIAPAKYKEGKIHQCPTIFLNTLLLNYFI